MALSKITTESILDGEITTAKLASGTGGKVLQVVEASQPALVQTTSMSWVDLTGMSVSLTPASTGSKVLVFANVNSSATNGANWVAFKLVRASTSFRLGDAASSRFLCHIAAIQTATDDMVSSSMSALDSPSTSSSVTYKVQWQLRNSSSGSANLNSTDADTDDNTHTRGVSNIIAIEISG